MLLRFNMLLAASVWLIWGSGASMEAPSWGVDAPMGAPSLIEALFDSHRVRATVIDDKVMFSATDIATALGYANPAKAYNAHCKLLKRHSYNEMDDLGFPDPNRQGEYLIPEGDVYRLVARSKLEGAQRFETWLFDEVVPQIRQTDPSKTAVSGDYHVTTRCDFGLVVNR